MAPRATLMLKGCRLIMGMKISDALVYMNLEEDADEQTIIDAYAAGFGGIEGDIKHNLSDISSKMISLHPSDFIDIPSAFLVVVPEGWALLVPPGFLLAEAAVSNAASASMRCAQLSVRCVHLFVTCQF